MSLPLFLEQGLVMLVGMVDIAIVSYAGDAAVSGVSLVNQFNIIFVYLFIALATGGAVVVSQYIGKNDYKNASASTSQLLAFSIAVAVAVSLFVGFGNEQILRMMFGRVAPDVFEACRQYLAISAFGYPALAIYNAGAVLFRSMGKTRTTMYISMIANVFNVVVNVLGVFVLNLGVAGVAWSSVMAISFSAVVITALGFKGIGDLKYHVADICKVDIVMLKRMLNIAVPNSLESGVAQLVKVALTSVIALFGTVQIAAYGVAQSIWSVAALMGVAMRPVFITVIGQCMGGGNIAGAEHYFRRLMKMTVTYSALWNLLVLLATPLLLNLYDLSDEIKYFVVMLVLLHNVFNAFAYPFSSALGSGLRATGDVRYTMVVQIASTIGVRLLLSFVLAIGFNMGVMGIAWAMVLDWTVCGAFFHLRQRAGNWKLCNVLG